MALARLDKPPARPTNPYRLTHTARPMDHIAPRASTLFLAFYCAR